MVFDKKIDRLFNRKKRRRRKSNGKSKSTTSVTSSESNIESDSSQNEDDVQKFREDTSAETSTSASISPELTASGVERKPFIDLSAGKLKVKRELVFSDTEPETDNESVGLEGGSNSTNEFDVCEEITTDLDDGCTESRKNALLKKFKGKFNGGKKTASGVKRKPFIDLSAGKLKVKRELVFSDTETDNESVGLEGGSNSTNGFDVCEEITTDLDDGCTGSRKNTLLKKFKGKFNGGKKTNRELDQNEDLINHEFDKDEDLLSAAKEIKRLKKEQNDLKRQLTAEKKVSVHILNVYERIFTHLV